jgi:hypothetical protein
MNSTASKLAVQSLLYFAIISTSISAIKPLMWVCNIDRGFGVCTAIIVLKYDVRGQEVGLYTFLEDALSEASRLS